MAARIELRIAFEQAIGGHDMPAARRIMDYARYCLAAHHADVNAAVAHGFIEHLLDEPPVRACLPELITLQEARQWRGLMSYHADEDALAGLEAAFRGANAVARKP